jgi:hypothetical protein
VRIIAGAKLAVYSWADELALQRLGGDGAHPATGMVVLLMVLGLNIYKPRGVTRYGHGKQRDARRSKHEQPTAEDDAPAPARSRESALSPPAPPGWVRGAAGPGRAVAAESEGGRKGRRRPGPGSGRRLARHDRAALRSTAHRPHASLDALGQPDLAEPPPEDETVRGGEDDSGPQGVARDGGAERAAPEGGPGQRQSNG